MVIEVTKKTFPESDPDPLKPGNEEEDLTCTCRLFRRVSEMAVYIRWLWCA